MKPAIKIDQITAFAPATVANVAVGFDILGFSMGVVGDRVTVTRTGAPGEITMDQITGVVTDLPKDPAKNTASVALKALCREARPPHGFRISIEKGIPLGSGMGGSAASAVVGGETGDADTARKARAKRPAPADPAPAPKKVKKKAK